MKDDKKRDKGKYVETFKKTKDDIVYTMIETIVIGRDSEILNYQREYNPGLKYPMTWEQV